VGTYIELQEESLERLKLLFQFGKEIYASLGALLVFVLYNARNCHRLRTDFHNNKYETFVKEL
jgi:hypothetical protein